LVETDSEGQIRRLLDRSIEDWMIYLHPSQRAIANATFNGPARVRGGPGTGKTVVALHRARVLARQRLELRDKVLLTTFLSTLPKVWHSLMGLLDPTALERLDIRNLDVLARSILASAHDRVDILDDARRRKIVAPLIKRHGLDQRIGENHQLLLDEFDAFLSGRGIDELEPYLALRRRGGGSPLGRADREKVFAAYEEYRARLAKERVYDWAHLRAEALRLAEEGAGPRFNGVIVDEAQDLSAVGMRLLLALDTSADHRHFLIVGDGQQSIYPGGFSLRELGIDIVGRSRVLTANWRNTWSVWTAAKAVVEGQEFDDLDEDVGLRPTGEEPEPLTVGDPAELHLLRTPGEELELLAALVAERVDAGIDAGDVAVLVDVKRKGDDVMRAFALAGVATHPLERYEGEHVEGVLEGTFNRAKGLEFKEVFIPGMSASEWPSRWFVPPSLDEDQRAERIALQLRTLFVGMSRARDRLTMLAVRPANEWVEAAGWTMDVREY
jgi:superfamily I DNA/RNA helicase